MKVLYGNACFSILNWIRLEKGAAEGKEMIKLAGSENAVRYETVRMWFARVCAKNV